MVDGVSGTDLYQLVLDPSREPQPPVADDWAPKKPATTAAFTATAAAEHVALAAVSGGFLRTAGIAGRDPR